MLYTKCPTCKQLLSDKELIYEEIFDKICNDNEIGKINDDEANNLKKELVNSMNLERYCCKQRLLTYIRLINIIK